MFFAKLIFNQLCLQTFKLFSEMPKIVINSKSVYCVSESSQSMSSSKKLYFPPNMLSKYKGKALNSNFEKKLEKCGMKKVFTW